MTSSTEVIALEGAGERGAPELLRFKTNFKPKKQLKHYPYFVDQSIVPRVKQYLEDNKDKVYVDIDEMVTELQRKYRDYAKKKRNTFKHQVEKAFSVVLKTYSMKERDAIRESDTSSVTDMDVDSEDNDLIVETNSSNHQIMNLYMQQQGVKQLANLSQGSITEGGKELIDISSDDEEEQVPAKRAKHADSSNGLDPKAVNPPNPALEKPPATNGQVSPEEVTISQVNAIQSKETPSLPAAVVADRQKRKRPTQADGSSGPLNADILRRRRREVPVQKPNCSFKDVGGCSVVLQDVCKLLIHIQHPEVFQQIGVSPPRGFLLHGPPGCGKSLLANAVAGELGVPLLKVAAPELVAGVSGESEERIRDLFDQAVSLAPCVLFLDEIDAITPNRNNAQREMERRIVAQLLTTLDELGDKDGGDQVLVIGATNRPDSIDPALRRAGRFDREVCMGIPDLESRAQILRVVCQRLALSPDVSSDAGIKELASLTPGYVGADLAALTREAAMVAVNRIFLKLQEKKSEPENNINCEPKVDNTTENKDSQQQRDKVTDVEAPVKTLEMIPANGEQADIEQDQVPPSTNQENRSDATSETCEVVNLDDGQPSDGTNPEQTNESVTEKQVEEVVNSAQASSLAEGESSTTKQVQEIVLDTEIIDKECSSTPTTETAAAQDIEIIPQTVDTQNSSLEQTEKKSKTDDDVEVLEGETANCEEQSSDPVTLPESSSEPTSKEEAESNIEQNDLVLSQKLNPLSTWSPELCQLLSWLQDTPPLSPTQLKNLTVTMADFHEALHHVQPSAKREGFVTVPDVTWDDVGSLSNVRAELQLTVLAPVRYAKQFLELGLNAPAGVLLCGPPGCGKTLLAKAVANEAGINFISVKGPELLNMYVGESERAVRQVFQRARNSAPCVIFFDELDALCPKRSDSGDNVSSRVVNQLLTEMDGVEGRSAVFLMAASNRPDIIDPAVLRPGRLDKIIYVGLPNTDDRKDILRALTKNGSRPQLSSDVDLAKLASMPQLENFTGADLAALVREAGVQALREFITEGGEPKTEPLCVALRHFTSAAMKIRPSVTSKDRKHYEKLEEMYSPSQSLKKPETKDPEKPATVDSEKLETMDTS